MKIELVPVIEISNYHQDLKMPDESPYLKNSDEWWENYNHLCNIKAGFSDKLKPILKGSLLYAIDEISDADLLKAIYREIEIQQTDEAKGVEDLECAFSGGYVLRIDNENIYFPQCCGDLADLNEWENLTLGKTECFYPGHPFPRVTENGNKICFDFINIEIQENFAPPPLLNFVEIEKLELKLAIEETKKELKKFANRLKLINQAEKLNITNIDKRLIWGEME